MFAFNILRSKETRAALAALDDLDALFAENLVFDDLKRALRSNILENVNAVRTQMEHGRSARDICLLALVKLAAEWIVGGQHHIYRGVLSLTGQQALVLWNKAMNDLVARNVLSDQVRSDRRRELQDLIRDVG